MLKLIAVLFAVIKGKCDYDDIVDDSGFTVREVIETLEKFPRYFKFDWATEFIRAADEGQDVAKGYALLRCSDGAPLWVGKVEKIYDRPE